MAISSEQYKTALFEQCRRALRIEDEKIRVIYFNMVYQVLEQESVTIDAEGYDGFRVGLEGYLNYLSDNNLLTGDSAYNDAAFVDKVHEYWGTAFAGIGVTMTVERESTSDTPTFTFVFPDETTQIYVLSDYNWGSPVQLNVRFNSTLDYAQKVMPYWDIQPSEDTVPLNELHRLRGSFVTNWDGEGVYWDFDKENQTIEFSGTGTLVMTPTNFTGTTTGNSMNLGNVLTAIYGAGVTGLPANAFNWGTAGTTRTIVCLHGAADEVTLAGSLSSLGSSSNPYTLEIYCDNEAIRAATFGTNVVRNWHSLSEWTG